MKKISTLFTSLIFTASVFAADRPKSTLMITLTDRSDIKVVVDGRRFEPDHNSIMIDGLDAGTHDVKVYAQKSAGTFFIFGKRYQVVFDGPVSVKPRSRTTLAIDDCGNISISDTRMFNRNRNFSYNNSGGVDYNSGNDGDYADNHGQWGGYDNHYGYTADMNDRDFNGVLQSISREWLESNKMKSATQIVTQNSLTAAQVKQLVLLFSFENNKLDLAKQAYFNTVDKENYGMLYSVFSFNSSKDELARFIRTSR